MNTEQKTDQQIDYGMEELIPVVAELTEKFTSAESSSVSYERARHLMEAVLYCIRECEKEQALLLKDQKLSAAFAYQTGYEIVKKKTEQAKEAYKSLLNGFCAYGNENYQDTVCKAIPGFFQYYDSRFAPQETIITMDYPVLMPMQELSGIDAVEQYITYLRLEQQFLHAFPETYVREILKSYRNDYEKQFDNLCRILLRHLLGKMLVTGSASQEEEPYEVLEELVCSQTAEELKKQCRKIIDSTIVQNREEYHALGEYLKADVDDIVTEMQNTAKHHRLHGTVVLTDFGYL